MSLWGDIRDRVNGETIRKEDQVKDFDNVVGSFQQQPITFVGCIDSEDDLRNVPRLCGKMYMVNDTIKIDGKEYHSGDIIIDDGQNWNVISQTDYIANSYIGQ